MCMIFLVMQVQKKCKASNDFLNVQQKFFMSTHKVLHKFGILDHVYSKMKWKIHQGTNYTILNIRCVIVHQLSVDVCQMCMRRKLF